MNLITDEEHHTVRIQPILSPSLLFLLSVSQQTHARQSRIEKPGSVQYIVDLHQTKLKTIIVATRDYQVDLGMIRTVLVPRNGDFCTCLRI